MIAMHVRPRQTGRQTNKQTNRRTDERTSWQYRDDSFERTHRALIKRTGQQKDKNDWASLRATLLRYFPNIGIAHTFTTTRRHQAAQRGRHTLACSFIHAISLRPARPASAHVSASAERDSSQQSHVLPRTTTLVSMATYSDVTLMGNVTVRYHGDVSITMTSVR